MSIPVSQQPPAAGSCVQDVERARAENLLNEGRVAEAERLLHELLRRDQNDARVLHLLGLAAFGSGKAADALQWFARAADADPRDASCAGVACQALGRNEEALTWHGAAAARSPNDPFVLNNFGAALAGAGRFAEAAEILRCARTADPCDGEILTNLCGALNSLGRGVEALEVGREAVRRGPGVAQAHNNLGNALLSGDPDAAADHYREALRLNPQLVEAYRGLGDALLLRGRPAEAARIYTEAVCRVPGDAAGYERLSRALLPLGRVAEARSTAAEAVRLAPGDAAARNTLANALIESGDLDGAASEYTRAIELRPGWSMPQYNRGVCRLRQGRILEALACLRTAMQLNPDDAVAHATYTGALHYDPGTDTATILAEHRLWAIRHGPLPESLPTYANDPDPNRPLRVGYLSPDFRNHAAAFFLQPIFANHDPAQVAVFGYAEVTAPDARTSELRSLASHWCETAALTDTELAERIRKDRIDILVDLAGHLAGGRLRALASKPAPLQVSYLGYPGTTGLPTIDYRLTDAVADPPGTEGGYSEELVHLPGCFCCYQPPPAFPVGPVPARAQGRVTFGSFHKLEKLNPAVLDLWSAVLHDVPNSCLLLARNHLRGPTADYWQAEFVRRGVAPQRIVLAAPEPVAMGHLHLYGRVDIALDPFPWGGHTTACEALWMGVPTVTMLGARYSGRMVASVFRTVGLSELVAEAAEDYRRIAAELAADEGRRTVWRTGLRERLLASPLCDGKAFTRGLEATYRQLWKRWCRGQQDRLLI